MGATHGNFGGDAKPAPLFVRRARPTCDPPKPARRSPSKKEAARAQHRAIHDYAVLGYCTVGQAQVETHTPWQLAAGDVLLIPSGMPHRIEATEAPEMWGIGFCPVCFLSPEGEDLLEPFDRVRRGSSAVVTIPQDRRHFFETLLGELERASTTASLSVQRSLVTLIMAEVAAGLSSRPGPDADDLVASVLRLIERECLGPLSLRDVAARVRRSPAHLTTLVKRATGRSVQEWIIAGRLSEARRRLLHSDESIEVIAERVGYADATHFIRIFRRDHLATPAAWRAKNRALHRTRAGSAAVVQGVKGGPRRGAPS